MKAYLELEKYEAVDAVLWTAITMDHVFSRNMHRNGHWPETALASLVAT